MTLGDATVLFRFDDSSLSITGWGMFVLVFIAAILSDRGGKS